MMDRDYTFAVARTRALEVSLFTQSVIEQLIAMKTYDEVLRAIQDKGWGTAETASDADAILAAENNKIWQTVAELGVPMEVFDVLSYPNLYHNVKTAIKEAYTNEQHDEFYFEGTDPSREEIRDIIGKKEFSKLPKGLDQAAQEAFEVIVHSGDGQMCDVIIDQACLKAIQEAGKESSEEIIKKYAEVTVATTNIKIAVRCQQTGKSPEFMRRAMVNCAEVDIERLIKAAQTSFDDICDYLSGGFAEAAEALRTSMSAFERWCDNYLLEMLRPQKLEFFSVGPIVAYVLARQIEIKTVGIILSGKRNNLPDEFIRERIREMYV
ncbi:V0D/AC39 family V-type ATPase subunit [Eubacterium oxidoreducens]|uniref:V/A-type H+-transporting ATPase subunit C n=1 Tax=Eubacterium oxidoreducens TaxID=1732 RepID=A0A1G6C7Q5_EUBOX|nr:V-type ATPase subunit [Eubacterium oxidoreducens]SDB28848.1 V/A-type H+-transporting ATPase subunit C [Eubacterium oxidoreducens]